MKMIIADVLFDGPHKSVKNLEKRPGVFAIISENQGTYYLLDVDHADDVKQAILDHERRACWQNFRRGLFRYAVLYTRDMAAEDREKIERKIRDRYKNIPCGGRGNP